VFAEELDRDIVALDVVATCQTSPNCPSPSLPKIA
jgi:hypothetical protein